MREGKTEPVQRVGIQKLNFCNSIHRGGKGKTGQPPVSWIRKTLRGRMRGVVRVKPSCFVNSDKGRASRLMAMRTGQPGRTCQKREASASRNGTRRAGRVKPNRNRELNHERASWPQSGEEAAGNRGIEAGTW